MLLTCAAPAGTKSRSNTEKSLSLRRRPGKSGDPGLVHSWPGCAIGSEQTPPPAGRRRRPSLQATGCRPRAGRDAESRRRRAPVLLWSVQSPGRPALHRFWLFLLLPASTAPSKVEESQAAYRTLRARRPLLEVPMTSRMRELIQQLGEAIHESVIESEQIAGVVQDIRQHGFDVLLMLEATIGLNELSAQEAADAEAGAEEGT